MAEDIGSAVVARLEWGDYLAVALYFISVISVGLWVRNICGIGFINLLSQGFFSIFGP